MYFKIPYHAVLFWFLAMFLAISITINAQQLNYTFFSNEHGLSQSDVLSLKEDSRGYLWVGMNGGGLNRFDGNKFTIFDENDGLAGSIIKTIEEDSEGNMWFGSKWGGVSMYNGRKFVNYTNKNGLLDNTVVGISRGKHNQIIIATTKGLHVAENGKITQLKKVNEKLGVTISGIFADSKGYIWIISSNKLLRTDGEQIQNMNELLNIGKNVYFTVVTEDHKGHYWLGSYLEGIFEVIPIDNNHFSIIPHTDVQKVATSWVNSLFVDKKDNIWVGTNHSGLFKFESVNKELQLTVSDFSPNIISQFCEDHFGNLWFGVGTIGLVKYTPSPFQTYEAIEGLKESSLFGLTYHEGKLWLASNGKGVYTYDGNKVKNYTSKNGLLDEFTTCLMKDNKGVLYIGTQKGLNYYKNGKFYSLTLSSKNVNVSSLMVDSKGLLWIGTYGSGLLKYDGKTVSPSNADEELSNDYILSIFEDSKKNIWVAANSGITKISPDHQFTRYNTTDGNNNYTMGGFAEDKYGNIWISNERGLIRYNGHEFKHFNMDNGLTSTMLYLLKMDKSGNLWTGHNKGVDKITIGQDGEFQDIVNYSFQEGFKGIECNFNAVMEDSVGNLYFGTLKGVIKYSPAFDMQYDSKPNLHITGIKVLGEETDLDKFSSGLSPWYRLPVNLQLPYDKNNLTFEYLGVDLHSPEKVKYAYKLDGIDKEWISTNTPVTTFNNLAPGQYIFKVRTTSYDKTHAVYAEYPFTILLPFWRTWWFIISTSISLLLIIYAVYRIRTHQIQKRNQELERLVQQRTSEIIKQSQKIETLFKEIHHRVKNNLQVINSLLNLQSYYITDEKTLATFKECQNRIYTMALLHEKLYATHDITSPKLDPYVHKLTEHLKDAYTLNYKVDFDIKINASNIGNDTIIPLGLLINELVSNSLKYAFKDKQECSNIITIHINTIDAKNHTMLIGDNGKGCKINFNREQKTFGLELAKILTEQLNGKINQLDQPGTMFRLEFQSIDKELSKTP